MTAAIRVRKLIKSYGERPAVDGIDLDVDEGEILAFLGPNGAGKTTTIEILEGFRSRTSGEVTVLGVDPADAGGAWRERIGIVLQESEPIPELTAAESVTMQSHYYSAPRDPETLLQLVGLGDSRDQRTQKLSGGQKRRLDLALALVGDPELVFLDEPTTGFDPSARRESWGMIEALREMGRTVLLTTHYMDEAEHLADRIAVIAEGIIVATGTAAELAHQVQAKPKISWSRSEADPHPPGELQTVVAGERMEITTTDIVGVLHALTGWSIAVGVDLGDLTVRHPSLEDVYLTLTEAAETGKEVAP